MGNRCPVAHSSASVRRALLWELTVHGAMATWKRERANGGLHVSSILSLPEYTVESISGEPHKQAFVVRCEVAEKKISVNGHGLSRRSAEQNAAEQMISTLISDSE